MIDLRPDLRKHFPGSEDAVFESVMALDGQVFRCLAGRKTLHFTLDGKGYFAKLHYGVGWREILKNLLMMRKPVLGARDEWQAIRRLEQLGVATMAIAGFGERGRLPSHQQSFLITDELINTISLEDYCSNWPVERPCASLKRALIEKVAKIARALHNHGVNHRDFYICHFLLDTTTLKMPCTANDITLYLIDLHRVQTRSHTPQRWLEKDVAALHFSSMNIGLTRRDRLRFMKIYRDRPLRQILSDEWSFWEKVELKARKLCLKPDND
ncbi:MAG: lipopolysaccharide core heptose(I) kinase RfaP [Desulfuromonadales bacterium]|nr:lipopolysaccharide core heptose(I) kinase RfaP [Desulfuromonadales bacterium]